MRYLTRSFTCSALLLFLLGGCTANTPAIAADHFELTLLHINDHHSHLEPTRLAINIGSADLDVDQVAIEYGGFALLAAAFRQLTAEAPNVLKLHAGDAVSGTAYYSLLKGVADAALMNTICFDAFTTGNHEFDNGDAGLAHFIDALMASDCATPVLAANVIPGPVSPLRNGYLQPYTIVERSGERIGIVGINIAGKTRNSSRPDPQTRLLDEQASAQRYIDEISRQGVNKIVLLTHLGYRNDMALAGALRNVDVIVGGDSHTLLGPQSLTRLGLKPVADYPARTTDALGQPVCVVQAWEYGRLLGKLSIGFDEQGVVTGCTGGPVLPFTGDYYYRDTGGQERTLDAATAAQVTAALKSEPALAVAPDPAAGALVGGFQAQLGLLGEQLIGHTRDHLCREYLPGQGRSLLCATADTWLHGSDMAQLVARSFLAATPTADIALQNAGGVRSDLAAGAISVADVFSVLPFNNTLVTLELTGAEVAAVIEEAVAQSLDNPATSGAYPYASGLRFHVDASRTAGNRVSGLEVNAGLNRQWLPLEATQRYRVVTNDFIASGKDGYHTLGQKYDNNQYTDTFTEYAQAFITYTSALYEIGKSLSKPVYSEYSTQSFINRAGCEHRYTQNCSD
ncbi:bifunctional metallophosphatase/5'-nucleotidase [Kineobactrum sediminis]|uniref:Bifunctional metallophosphatase/5'-nucleotidase n=1 Tax=Kineobactrum sediminis TaxID=1905677 RepID=A0A2N5Y617_9GAMM|nr:5'-nucleotidase C-terminal domain-containing protein [Kineobactrum sediminis]PLW83821.1 bifunctional metallophosphatase/5'-nucleotidase [Kineobactrum sediminis]